MQDKLLLIRNKNKPFESKCDSLEWLSRYANFYSPDNVYSLITAFKEIYTGNDVNYRTAYIDAKHGSDSIYILINGIRNETNKMNNLQAQSLNFSKNLTGSSVVMESNETKIAFLLNLMEPLIVNDLNNEIAI